MKQILFYTLFTNMLLANQSPISPKDQALCSRSLITEAHGDYVTNVTSYRIQTDKITDGVVATRRTFIKLIEENPYLKPSGSAPIVVSIGEGFGRDIKFFRNQGFRAIGTDGSAAMVRESWDYLGTQEDFYLMIAQDFSLYALDLADHEKLAGIWAMASLHHIPVHELQDVFIRMRDALLPGGIIHASFAMGVGNPNQAEVAINRFWSRIDAPTLIKMVQKIDGLEIINESGKKENDFFSEKPSASFHFYHLWLKRTQI